MAAAGILSPVSRPVRERRPPLGRILGGCAVMFLILQGGLMVLLPSLDQTSSSLIVAGAMLLALFAIERIAFDRSPATALRSLGYGRARPEALLAAAIIAAAMLACFPLYSLATGTTLVLKSDWIWILVGAIVLNGICEETLFRGFVFGHLRQGGYSFRKAGAISALIFGAVHLFLFTGNPPIIAALATALAVSAAFPFAFLFERAGMSIWAGVVLHTSSHAFRLIDIPASQTLTIASAWILVQFGAVFLVFAFRHNLLRPPGPPASTLVVAPAR